jgi:hypothetical protein
MGLRIRFPLTCGILISYTANVGKRIHKFNGGGRAMIKEEEFGKELVVLKLIWFAMLISLAVYLFVGLQVGESIKVSMNADTFSVLRSILYVVAFVELIITKYIRNLILSAKGQFKPATQGIRHPVIQKYTTAMMVALGLSESIGIYGLILFFLGKNTTDLYLLILISAAAMFMYRPKKEEVISMLQKNFESPTTGEQVKP